MHPNIEDPAAYVAVTRAPSTAISRCELSYLPREPIDWSAAHRQHTRYVRALASLGLSVVSLETGDYPDGTFVEDMAIVLDEIAVITSPIASRRGEQRDVSACLTRYRDLCSIAPHARLEGGDVVLDGRTLYVGCSRRTDRDGLGELRKVVASHGYVVRDVEVRGCLHLSTGASSLRDETFLINPHWVDATAFRPARILCTPESEPWAANVLPIGDHVIAPSGYPRTCEMLAAEGYSVIPIDISELAKGEGGVTCLSLTFKAAPRDCATVSTSAAPAARPRTHHSQPAEPRQRHVLPTTR